MTDTPQDPGPPDEQDGPHYDAGEGFAAADAGPIPDTEDAEVQRLTDEALQSLQDAGWPT